MGSAAQADQRGKIASQSLFTAASAVNAIPVAGQFVSAGLAIAGLFVKIFAGRRKRKKEARERAIVERNQKDVSAMKEKGSEASGGTSVGAQQSSQPLSLTATAGAPVTSSFSSWGGGNSPSVQPTQQVLNNQLGVK